MLLNYIKYYRKLLGGKWYKIYVFRHDYYYYTRERPKKINHWVVEKYYYKGLKKCLLRY